MVSFPDVAGANTSGSDRYEALEMAEDALWAALAGHMKLRRSIPVPSAMVDGQEIVVVNPIAAAKLELYSAMRDQGITKRALAERLGLSDTTVGRLTDPDHRSHIRQVTRALRSVGRNPVIEGRADPVRQRVRSRTTPQRPPCRCPSSGTTQKIQGATAFRHPPAFA
ncbi:MAG: type II toxin-antitoxin system HicB family antitoxin [Bryobacterales bacterium]|nr:type II toxin-antitoxin system HicB family antitoxin [Bryobacterales bacterium]